MRWRRSRLSDKRAERAALDEVVAVVETAVRRIGFRRRTPTRTCSAGSWRRGRRNRTDVRHARNRAGRRAHPHRLDVQSDGRAGLGARRPARTPVPSDSASPSGDIELAQRCALESTRLAQRSIMSRAVLAPVDLDTGDQVYRVPAGWTIATLLPLLNTSAAPGLQTRGSPNRWHRHRLADTAALRVADVGHGVRARQAFVPGAAILAGGDDGGDDPPVGQPVRDHAGLAGLPAAGTGPDRWRRPRGGPVPYPLLRSAVASPLIVSRMPRWTSSSSSPDR